MMIVKTNGAHAERVVKREPCHLALSALDPDDVCGCGHPARDHVAYARRVAAAAVVATETTSAPRGTGDALVAELENDLARRDARIVMLETELAKRDARIAGLEAEVKRWEARVVEVNKRADAARRAWDGT